MRDHNGNKILFANVFGLVDIDKKFNPESENPQSGIAVNEAINYPVGIARGVSIEISDMSHEQHAIECVLDDELGVGLNVEPTSFGYVRVPIGHLPHNSYYQFDIVLKEGKEFSSAVIEASSWKADRSPSYSGSYSTFITSFYLFEDATLFIQTGSIDDIESISIKASADYREFVPVAISGATITVRDSEGNEESFTAAEDGTVEGIISKHPLMTLSSNVAAMIHCRYIKECTMASLAGQMVDGKMADKKPWTPLYDLTLTEAVSEFHQPFEKEYAEIYLEAIIKFETDFGDTAKTLRYSLSCRSSVTTHTDNLSSISNGTTSYMRAHGHKTPTGYLVYDVVCDKWTYTSPSMRSTAGGNKYATSLFNQFRILSETTGIRFGVGSNFKVWGR